MLAVVLVLVLDRAGVLDAVEAVDGLAVDAGVVGVVTDAVSDVVVAGTVSAVLSVDAAPAAVAQELSQVCQLMRVSVALSHSFVPVVKYAGNAVEPPMSAWLT